VRERPAGAHGSLTETLAATEQTYAARTGRGAGHRQAPSTGPLPRVGLRSTCHLLC
jgi:hypothetical protein